VSIFFALALSVNLTIMTRITYSSHSWDYPIYTPLRKPVAWQSYENVFRWIKDNTRQSDVIASGLDTMIFLYTGRQAFRPFFGRPTSLFYKGKAPALGSWEEVLTFLERYKARFLVQVPMPGFMEEKYFDAIIQQLIIQCPGLLKLVYMAPDSRFVIYEIKQSPTG
jgi:hypothetical protein